MAIDCGLIFWVFKKRPNYNKINFFYMYDSKRNFFGCSSDHIGLGVEPQLVGKDKNRISYKGHHMSNKILKS